MNTSKLLILTDTGLFEEQVLISHLTDWFSDYEGDNSYSDARECIRNRFEVLHHGESQIYTHFIDYSMIIDPDQSGLPFFRSTIIDIPANRRGIYP